MIDWNDLAYKAGQAANRGVQRLNQGIEAGDRIIRDKINEIKETRQSNPVPINQPNPMTPTERERILWESEDSLAQINQDYGPGRVIIIDWNDGSRSYRKIHDHQRSADAVTVVSQIITNQLESRDDNVDIINVPDPYNRKIRVIIGVHDMSRFQSPTLDRINPASMEASKVPVKILAVVSTAHLELPAGAEKTIVPYDPASREWPWARDDSSKYKHAATEYRSMPGWVMD